MQINEEMYESLVQAINTAEDLIQWNNRTYCIMQFNNTFGVWDQSALGPNLESAKSVAYINRSEWIVWSDLGSKFKEIYLGKIKLDEAMELEALFA